MADQSPFSQISVTTEDEIVIQAGATNSSSQQKNKSSASQVNSTGYVQDILEEVDRDTQDTEKDVRQTNPNLQDSQVQTNDRLSNELVEEADDLWEYATESDRRALAQHLEEKRKREEFRMQTTTRDLRARGPFTRMRAIIIAIALLGIAAWLTWWFLNH